VARNSSSVIVAVGSRRLSVIRAAVVDVAAPLCERGGNILLPRHAVLPARCAHWCPPSSTWLTLSSGHPGGHGEIRHRPVMILSSISPRRKWQDRDLVGARMGRTPTTAQHELSTAPALTSRHARRPTAIRSIPRRTQMPPADLAMVPMRGVCGTPSGRVSPDVQCAERLLAGPAKTR
jgi:hypothetical protein